MVLVAAVLAAGTILEKINPEVHIYTSWWFIALMAVVAVASIVSIVQRRMWRRPSLLLVHASVAVILAGGALTTWTGQHGSMTLKPGVPCTEFDGHKLPFSITLDHFEVIPYPGTHTPMDFVSHVRVEGQQYDISMNNILKHRGYRFYQEDYDNEGNSTLSVAHDPWGIGVTYSGYILLMLGLIGLMVSPQGLFRRLLRGAAVTALLLLPLTTSATPQTLPRTTAEEMGKMQVLYKGRVCPLQTLAKDFTTKLTGNATYHGLSAEQVLSGYLFYFDQWIEEPAIKHQSYLQLLYLDTVTMTPQSNKQVRAEGERYNLVKMLLSGKLLKLFPIAGEWYAQNDELPLSVDDDEYMFVRRWQSYCQELALKGDYEELERVFEKTQKFQQKNGVLPPSGRLKAEHLYNALTTGKWLAMISITLGLIVFAYSLSRLPRRRWMTVAATVWVATLTAFLLLIFILRWVAGCHIPMAGGFDSMNLMSIVIGIITLTMVRHHPMAPAIGMLTMGFCQLVAMMSGSNPPVTHLMPVLNSPLLTLHVVVIMCSYALLFFVSMIGTAGLITSEALYRRLIMLLLYPAVSLLAVGIMIGAVWANISWGNYWSWDPKEVWALITLIVYTLPLHPHVLKRPRMFYLYCLLAFLSVVVTYFGVNLILGGIHAYR